MNKQEDTRYCIALQPICDAQFHHIADEVLYRANGGASTAEINDPLLATARACGAAFYEIGLQALVGTRDLFLNVSREWLARPEIMPLPPEQVVVELPHTVRWSEEIRQNVEGIQAQGYRMAVDQSTLLAVPELAPLVSIVKIDMRRPDAFEHLTRFRELGLTLLGQFIEDAAMLERCREHGFDLYQGYFYAIPELVTQSGSTRTGNRPAQLKLIRELYAAEPDIDRLEGLMAQDPHLCSLLFKRVNSASDKRTSRVSNLHQAIMMLGFDKVRAITSTLLLSENEPVKQMLVFRALVRAALARQLARRSARLDPETAFTLGLFSLIDQLEGVSREQLALDAGFNEEMTAALVQGKGDLGKVLLIIEAFEEAAMEKRSVQLVETLNREYLISTAWAQEVMALTQEP